MLKILFASTGIIRSNGFCYFDFCRRPTKQQSYKDTQLNSHACMHASIQTYMYACIMLKRQQHDSKIKKNPNNIQPF